MRRFEPIIGVSGTPGDEWLRRDKPAWRKEMKVLYIEGVATHDGPEPCAVAREGGGEASVGVVRAGLLSREMQGRFGVPTLSLWAEGHTTGDAIASRRRTPCGRRTQARTKLSMRENREVPRSPAGADDAPSIWIAGWQVGAAAGREGNAKR